MWIVKTVLPGGNTLKSSSRAVVPAKLKQPSEKNPAHLYCEECKYDRNGQKQSNKQQRVDRQSLQGPYPQLFVCHFPSAMHSSENCTYLINLLFLLGMQIWHFW